MNTEKKMIAGVPALVIGEATEHVWLFVHGKMGCKEEALDFVERGANGGDRVIAVDLPEHGERADGKPLLPWVCVQEIKQVMREIRQSARRVSLRATSIGAWMSMLALQDEPMEKALLVSPVVDMENLIINMMMWAGVTETELREKGEIPTTFGETLSWEYLCWVREHPMAWRHPTAILYPEKDNLTSKTVIRHFAQKNGCELTVLPDAEHWIHTEAEIAAMAEWENTAVQRLRVR